MFTKELNVKLGDILLTKGIITQEQLEKGLKEQNSAGASQKRIGSHLLDLGYVTEEDIMEALGLQFNLPVMRIGDLRIKPDVLDLIPESMAKKFNVIPLFKIGEELTLAISDPTEIHLLDIVHSQTGCKVMPVISPYSEIAKLIDRYYLKKIEMQMDEKVREALFAKLSRTEIEELKKAGVDLPVVKIVDRILLEAVDDGASDIHIEPGETATSVRFRIDGVLQEFAKYPKKLHLGIVSRTKILSSMDIAEKQKPQDGRIQIKLDANELDIRVSTLPTHFGEKVVMRLLHRSTVKVTIEDLGFSPGNLSIFRKLIHEPYGIILVTGPTGSGKTTTLYAALNEIRSVEKNIVTVEDPVEYQLPLISQVQINLRKDLTFANALRSILRQDPDIIMIGEIRDPETASIAAEAALTGHLVFSTLHTNDAPSSITRLTDMGVEPFLFAPSLLGIVAQRLVRKICSACREEYSPSEAELLAIDLDSSVGNVKFSRGRGCDKCKQTGYKGRTAVHEVLAADDRIREVITKKGSAAMILEEALRKGFKNMRFDGMRKVFAGETTVEELLRVTKNS